MDRCGVRGNDLPDSFFQKFPRRTNVQVVDAVSTGSTIDSSAQGIIQHMELVSTEYMEDGGCAVIMRLSREQLKKAGLDPEGKK